VRLCRRRFWKGEYTADKISAYQTLYNCLETIAKLMAPIAPFFSDQLFLDLNAVTEKDRSESVHLSNYPVFHEELVDKSLEERMTLAQDISSLTLSLRKKVGINVRQPLNKILLPVLDESFSAKVEKVKDLILSETNIKEIEFIEDTSGIIRKKIKPNFKTLGPKVGKDMKLVSGIINAFGESEINQLEKSGSYAIPNTQHILTLEDVEIIAEDVAGWQVANLDKLTVALDVNISVELKNEGIARELINRIQTLRKELKFEVTDKINVTVSNSSIIADAIKNNLSYISTEILANSFKVENNLTVGERVEIETTELNVLIEKV